MDMESSELMWIADVGSMENRGTEAEIVTLRQ